MLWGKPSGIFVDEPESAYTMKLFRRHSVDKWLKEITSIFVQDDINRIQGQISSEEDKYNAIVFQVHLFVY
jgi:hypothetical protein